jgi:hypothetical protein
MKKVMPTKKYEEGHGWLDAFFEALSGTLAERARLFGLVALLAFLYGVVNDGVFGRPPERVSREVIAICVVGSVALALLLHAAPRLRSWVKGREKTGRLEPYERNMLLIRVFIFSVVALLGFCQTQLFVKLTTSPRMLDEYKLQMEASRERQLAIARAAGKERPHGLASSPLFFEWQRKAIRITFEEMKSNEDLNSELARGLDGVSLRDVSAEVLPEWEVRQTSDAAKFGLTEEARRAFIRHDIPFQLGYTLRDTEVGPPVTLDGTPKIILGPQAFVNEQTLRRILFHELLHALNVPSYRPSPIAILQDDLAYLPVYRRIVSEEGLDAQVDYFIWFAAVLLPLFLAVRAVYLLTTRPVETDVRTSIFR